MELIPIQVECCAGTKAGETPRRFTWQGRTIELDEVLDRWHQVASEPEWPRADYKYFNSARAWRSVVATDTGCGQLEAQK